MTEKSAAGAASAPTCPCQTEEADHIPRGIAHPPLTMLGRPLVFLVTPGGAQGPSDGGGGETEAQRRETYGRWGTWCVLSWEEPDVVQS